MFTIMRPNQEYFHSQGKIIIFETPEEANAFINALVHYSVERLQAEGRTQEAMTVPMVIMQESNLVPVDFDINTVECGVVFCRDLCK